MQIGIVVADGRRGTAVLDQLAKLVEELVGPVAAGTSPAAGRVELHIVPERIDRRSGSGWITHSHTGLSYSGLRLQSNPMITNGTPSYQGWNFRHIKFSRLFTNPGP